MFKRILVPLDGSDLAEKIVPIVSELAEKHVAELVFIRVYQREQALAAPVSTFDTYHLVVSVAEARKRAQKYLGKMKELYRELPVQVVGVESMGGVGKTIAEQASENDIDLIAMSSHGYTGFRRLMMGSVTTETLKYAACPVLVVPANSFTS